MHIRETVTANGAVQSSPAYDGTMKRALVSLSFGADAQRARD